MITELVLMDLPENMTREQVVEGMRQVAQRWRDEPELIRKTFVYDAQARQTGAFYLWTNRLAAERAHDEVWRQRVVDTFGCEPSVRFFETPMVVDNVLGRTIEE